MRKQVTTSIKRQILERWEAHDGTISSLASQLIAEGVIGKSATYRVIYEATGDDRAKSYISPARRKSVLPVPSTDTVSPGNPAQGLLDEVLGIAAEVEGFLKAFATLKTLGDTLSRVDELATSLKVLKVDHERLQVQLRARESVINGLVPVYARQARVQADSRGD